MFKIVDIFSGITDIIKEPIVEWQKRKTIQVESKMEVEKLLAQAEIAKAQYKLDLIKEGMIIEADWDSKAQEQMRYTWKDEALLVIIYFPVVILFASIFISGDLQQRVIISVQALNDFPTWYKMVLMGIIASVYGLRWLVSPLVNKLGEGNKKNGEK